MSRSLKHWKDASSLIIAARRSQSGSRVMPVAASTAAQSSNVQRSCDYQMLLLKRQRRGTFANAHVFPGGVIDKSDFSPKWLDIFKQVGITDTTDFGLPNLQGKPRPFPVNVERDPGLLPNDVAFRICALRETFEESGILLLSNAVKTCGPNDHAAMASCYHGDLNKDDLRYWQKKVHNNGSLFLDLCSELKAVPDIWSLREWFHVLTPQIIKKRYDTMFYFCAMDSIPTVQIDDLELVQTEWGSPSEILHKFGKREVLLEPPQVILMASLLKFLNLEELNEFSKTRQLHGLPDLMPYLFQLKDCVMTTLPGDDMYPSDVEYHSIESIPKIGKSIEEVTEGCKNYFRSELCKTGIVQLHCNVQLPCGVPSPPSVRREDWKSLDFKY